MFKKLSVIILLIFSLGVVGCGNKPAESDSKEKKEVKETGYEHKKSDFDFTNAEMTEDNIIKSIKQYTNKDDISDLKVKIDKNWVFINYNYNKQSDEQWIKNASYIANDIFQALLCNNKIEDVTVYSAVKILDKNGNDTYETVQISMKNEDYKKINWSNFNKLVKDDYKALHKTATCYTPNRMNKLQGKKEY